MRPLRVNFRDVAENVKGVRRGKLYRSSCCFTPPSNVAAIVDIRRGGAKREKWHYKEDGTDVNRHHIPMVGAWGGLSLLMNLPSLTLLEFLLSRGSEVVVGKHYFASPDNIVDMYVRIAENASRELIKIAEIICTTHEADSNAGVVIFCVAGKDRTGIVASLFARLVGASIEDIAADYAQSQDNLMMAQSEGHLTLVDPLLLDSVLTQSPWGSMLAFLRTIETRYGSVRQFMETKLRMDPALITRLVEALKADDLDRTLEIAQLPLHDLTLKNQ